ncbi:MAG: hypothetical protein QOJ39_1276, partial [Candidatus Eremiobacteraeota bacterium]|nr:hypothetical protein [Candidatus Eremiobacteraeota bacterium]
VALAASLGVVGIAAPLAPNFGVAGAPAVPTGAPRHVVRAQLFVVDQRGNERDLKLPSGTVMYRSELSTFDDLHSAGRLDPKHLRAVLQQLEADAHTSEADRTVIHKIIQHTP